MRSTKQCPKCLGTDLVHFEGSVGPYGTGNNLMIGASIFSAVKVNRYVCCRCGFTEEWVDREDLERIKNSKKAIK